MCVEILKPSLRLQTHEHFTYAVPTSKKAQLIVNHQRWKLNTVLVLVDFLHKGLKIETKYLVTGSCGV